MNRFIFDTLTFLNGIIALLAIVLSAIAGYSIPAPAANRTVGLLLGGGTGLLIAAVFCGTIAFMALVEQHLGAIAKNTDGERGLRPASQSREEPTLSDDWSDYR